MKVRVEFEKPKSRGDDAESDWRVVEVEYTSDDYDCVFDRWVECLNTTISAAPVTAGTVLAGLIDIQHDLDGGQDFVNSMTDEQRKRLAELLIRRD